MSTETRSEDRREDRREDRGEMRREAVGEFWVKKKSIKFNGYFFHQKFTHGFIPHLNPFITPVLTPYDPTQVLTPNTSSHTGGF